MKFSYRSAGLLGGLLLLASAGVQAKEASGLKEAGTSSQSPALTEREQRHAAKQARMEAKRAKKRAEREARERKQAPTREARAFRKLKVSGEDLHAAQAKVSALTWHGSLAAAQAEAQETGKPILWIQTLGERQGLL